MIAASKLNDMVQLAEASYTLFNSFPPVAPHDDNSLLNALRDKELRNSEFSLSQAQDLVSKWRLVDHRPDTPSGFSATLFASKEKSSDLVLAIRGTEFDRGIDEAARDLGSSDINGIILEGMAVGQIVDLYNYWKQLTAVQGATVRLARVIQTSDSSETGIFTPGYPVPGTGGASVVYARVEFFSSPGTGLGLATGPISSVNVTGHSLGGHLSTAFLRLFSDSTPAEVVTVNGMGTGEGSVVNAFLDALAERSNTSFMASRIANVYGSAGQNLATGELLYTQYGERVQIYTESAGLDAVLGHGRKQMSDSAAVYDLFLRTDGALASGAPLAAAMVLLDVYKVASAAASFTLESMVNALGKLFVTDYLPMDATVEGNREALYEQILAVRNQIPRSGLSLRSLVGMNADSLKNLTINGDADAIAYRYALRELNPFAVLGPSSLYVPHNQGGELELHLSPADTSLGMTTEYIVDRASFLHWKMSADTADTQVDLDVSASDHWRFDDRPQAYSVQVNGGFASIGAPARVAIFGGSRADAIVGGPRNDRLYGEGGVDFLTGGRGDDYLEGGAGLDVYTYSASTTLLSSTNDGVDEIRDTDGKGIIRYSFTEGGFISSSARSTVIGGVGIYDSDTEWRSPDGKFTYTAFAEGLFVTINGDAGGSIFIRDFDVAIASERGYLGIRLVESPVAPISSATSREIIGDRALLVATATVPAIFIEFTNPDGTIGHAWVPQTEPHWTQLEVLETYRDASGTPTTYDVRYKQFDDLDNLVRSLEPSFGFKDEFLDGPGNDHIATGDGVDTITASRGGHDYIEAGGGDDDVWAGPGSDWVEGGAGQDLLIGEAGNDFMSGDAHRDRVLGGDGDDWLEGGADPDIVAGSAGNDVIFAGTGRDAGGTAYALAFLLASGQTAAATLGQGELLDGGAGNDLLVGGSTADQITAGEGEDIVLGGAGDDTIYGDASIPYATLDWFIQRNVSLFGDLRVYEVLHSFDTEFVNDPSIGGADVIYGGAGEDWIFGGAGDDYLDGGDAPGNANTTDDVLFGEAGSDILIGGSGNDFLAGDSALSDEMGLSGDDYLMGGAGDDYLLGGHGNDILDGGTGDDILLGGEGDDILWGGPGTDVLIGGPGKDTYLFHRGDGIEVVQDAPEQSGAADASVLAFGSDISRSQVKFRLGSLVVDLGNGDAIHFEGFNADDPLSTPVLGAIQFADGGFMTYAEILAQGFVFDGTDGDDEIFGTAVTDHIEALGGDDFVYAKGGDDHISGGAGDDEIHAGDGNDQLTGGAGNDVLRGGAGNDALYGDEGDDYLEGGTGDDSLVGGAGTDSYLICGGMGEDTVTDGEAGEGNVLLLGAGVTLESLATRRVEDALVVSLRGTNDSLTIAGYYSRPQAWIVRDVLGAETALETALDWLDPYAGDFVAKLWDDVRLGATATMMGVAYGFGWRALDQDTFEMFQDDANLLNSRQTTVETITRAEAPFDVLSHNTDVDLQETILSFGLQPDARFRWALQRLESARQQSDDAVIVGNLGEQGITQAAGHAVITLRRDRFRHGAQHAAWSNAGGVISYQTGTSTVVAFVRYDYELESYREGASVVSVSPGAGNWPHEVDALVGDRALVDMLRMERRYIGVLELIGGDSDNVIYSGGSSSIFGSTVLVDAGAGDDVVVGGSVLYGNAGNDELHGGGAILIGGDGDDALEGTWNSRFAFTATEVGIDTIAAPSTSAEDYLDWYYAGIGMPEWRINLEHGGRYAAVVQDVESSETRYFDSLEEAEAAGGTDIRFVAPLDVFAPLLRRDDAATLELLAAQGGLSRDAVLFGPGLALEDLDLAITVFGPKAEAHSVQPWLAGGTLSVRWNGGATGFDVVVPDVAYGFTGTNLVTDGWETYRLGEGIEAFEFADGAAYHLEQLLARASVIMDYGYSFLRGSGSQVIEPRWGGVDFAGDIAPSEVSAYRDGGDLVLTLGDGSAQATLPGWFADPPSFSSWVLHFGDGTSLDAAATTQLGLTRKGTEGPDVLVGDPELPSWLYGHGGDDVLIGGAGDDYLDGGDGIDTYIFHAGNGADVIADAGPSIIVFGEDVPSWSVGFGIGSLVVHYAGADSIRFTAFDTEDPQATPVFERLEFADGSVISYADFLQGSLTFAGTDADDVITGTGIRDVLFGYGGNDVLYGGGGNDDLYGGEGDDMLAGGPGDHDSLVGEEGADTYLYARGDGRDEVDEWDETPGDEDRVRLQGFAFADVRVTRDPWNYYLVMGGGDRLMLANMAAAAEAVVERIEFEDGTVWTPSEVEARVELLPGTDGEDVLWGTAGADTISGLGAYDELYGNGGDDYLAGGEGGDLYYFAAGDGHDTVDNCDTDGSFDAIYFADAASSDAVLSRDGIDLVISLGADSVSLSGWYLDANYRIDAIHFGADGGYWDAEAIEALAPTAGNSAPVVAHALATLSFDAGAASAYLVPAGTFFDADPGDALALSASLFGGGALPSWLSFDASAGEFRGAPQASNIGIYHLAVTATDAEGASATSDFGLIVRAAVDSTVTGRRTDDVIYGNTGNETLIARGGSDYLYGDAGDDLLRGGDGQDVLQGGGGNDVLRGGAGQNVLEGGAGDDLIYGGAGSAFIAGGAGNDVFRVGSGRDVIAFNAGDGVDAIYGGKDGGNTLSFGGGIDYSDIRLSKSGKDLVVSTGVGEGVTLKNWYGGNHSVLNLQIVLDATEEFDASSSDPLYNRRVQTFNFLGMVSAFDAARAATPGLTSWEITNALLAFHLSGADDMALGGDLAYWYGRNRSLRGISLQAAQEVIGTTNFGAEAQSLRPFNGLQEGFVKLA
jgi:Ca2+-binding RTX toxin-like protein